MSNLSNRLSILVEEYPGNLAWNNFVSSFPDLDADLLTKIPIENDCAKVIYWKKGNKLDEVKKWLAKPIPALDGKTPLEILSLEHGKTILRTAIMRMP